MPPPRRFTAPAAPGGVLADPPFADVPGLVEANRRKLDVEVEVGGLPLRELRALARREIGVSAGDPLLLAGHQPELPHPGVWAKHFALNGLARKLGGVAVNLVADTDTLKTAAVRVPVRDPDGAHLELVPFDHRGWEEPYETRAVRDAGCFRTFADRAAAPLREWGIDPLVCRVWPGVLADPAPTVGAKFAAARRRVERGWGCHNRELPVSTLAGTDAFRRFVAHITGDAERFRRRYNAAVRAYRAAHGIASRNHPVPDLADDEIPFWVVVRGGRREKLTAGATFDAAAVRPRALTLTLFARVCLGDFFIHGIGGGTYDEVTDAIIRDYFGIDPPAYQVVTATLPLPLPTFPGTAEEVRRLARRERELVWTPHRHLPASAAAHAEIVAAVDMDPKERFREFRALAADLRPAVEGELAAVRGELARARREAEANAVLRRRDFAWVLYPEETLRPFLQQFLAV